MRRPCTIILSALISGVLAVSCASRGELAFVHMSDPQIGFIDESEHYMVSDSLLRDAVEAINFLKPACVICTGDLLNVRKNNEQKEIYKMRMAEIDPSIPVFVTPGNHDITGFDEEVLSGYIDLVGYDRFSFAMDGCAFIGFDSCRIKSGPSEMEEEQFEWLEGELAKYRKMRHKLVFFHCPVVLNDMDEEVTYESFPKELRAKYMGLFKKYGVEAMFTGHTHRGFTNEIEGIHNYNVGPVANAFPGFHSGFNLVKVGRDSLEVTFKHASEFLSESNE